MADAKIIAFWTNKTPPWPEDRQGYTFLLNAVHIIGKALFQGEWTGYEPVVPNVPVGLVTSANGIMTRTPVEKASIGKQITAYNALRAVDKELPLLSPLVLASKAPVTFTAEQWERALDQTALIDFRNESAFKRFVLVMQYLAKAMGDGLLKSVVRPIEGGAYSLLPADVWNTEHYVARFAFGQINMKAPYGEGVCDTLFPSGQTHTRKRLYDTGCDFRFIMVNSAELDQLIPKGTTPKQAEPADETAAVAPLGETSLTTIDPMRPSSKNHLAEKVDRWLRENYRDAQPTVADAEVAAKNELQGITRKQVREAMKRVGPTLNWIPKTGPRGPRS